MAAIEPPRKHRSENSGWKVATLPGNTAIPMMPTPKIPSATTNRRRSMTRLSLDRHSRQVTIGIGLAPSGGRTSLGRSVRWQILRPGRWDYQQMRRMPGRLHPSQGADTNIATGKTPGDACLASFNNLTSSRICPANERETSGKGPERALPEQQPPGARLALACRAARPRDPHPTRRSPTGRRVDPVGLRSGADQQPRDHGVGIPYVARVQLVSAPHRRRYERHQVKYPLGAFRVGRDADRALD